MYIRRPDLEKCIHRSPDMMCESRNGYRVVFTRLVANLDLTLEVFVADPLNTELVKQATLIIRREMILTPMRMCVVDFCPSGANCCALRRPWHRPAAESSRDRPSLPSLPSKKMGICNTASSTCCLLSVTVFGDHIAWGTTVPLFVTERSTSRIEVSNGCALACRVGPTKKK